MPVLSLAHHSHKGQVNIIREKRTLWFILPDVGARRLGFISKVNDHANLSFNFTEDSSNAKLKDGMVGDEELSTTGSNKYPRKTADVSDVVLPK